MFFESTARYHKSLLGILTRKKKEDSLLIRRGFKDSLTKKKPVSLLGVVIKYQKKKKNHRFFAIYESLC